MTKILLICSLIYGIWACYFLPAKIVQILAKLIVTIMFVISIIALTYINYLERKEKNEHGRLERSLAKRK